MAATHRRSVSWLSLSSVRRPATPPPPPTLARPPARSDPIRPPAFKPFRTLSSTHPQKPTWPPVQRAQTPQPPPVQRPPFRSATAAAKPAAASPPPQPAAAAQRSSPPPTLTITSPANAPNKAPTTTTSPALKSQPIIATSIPTSPITTNLSSPSTIFQQSNTSSAETEHKSILVQQLTEKSNLVPPNVDTKHHKLQNRAQIAKPGVAIEEKGIAMQRKHLEEPKKHGMRIVRLVGDNVGAAMVVNNKEKNRPKTLLQSKSSNASTLFMNSNVQGVNNSIAFDSCLAHHDPGLHVCTFEP